MMLRMVAVASGSMTTRPRLERGGDNDQSDKDYHDPQRGHSVVGLTDSRIGI
jgi:hypothetical protein